MVMTRPFIKCERITLSKQKDVPFLWRIFFCILLLKMKYVGILGPNNFLFNLIEFCYDVYMNVYRRDSVWECVQKRHQIQMQ